MNAEKGKEKEGDEMEWRNWKQDSSHSMRLFSSLVTMIACLSQHYLKRLHESLSSLRWMKKRDPVHEERQEGRAAEGLRGREEKM